MNIYQSSILILDFGSQYTQLIARQVRAMGVYCELHAYDISTDTIKALNPDGIILSGGPESLAADNAPIAPPLVYELGVPVLGICYGMQTMSHQLGGEVKIADKAEYGYTRCERLIDQGLFDGISDYDHQGKQYLDVWMSHSDQVTRLPEGFVVSASTENAEVAAIEDPLRQFYAVQFHPEVTHTVSGQRILSRFVLDICGCQQLWTPLNIIEHSVETIRRQVGDEHVLVGLSGGVDSSVVAALIHQAVGEQLTCIFVDTGLLRMNEGDQVMASLNEHLGVRVIRVNAAERFLSALRGIVEPEDKRKIIGHLFIEIFNEEAAKIDSVKWLGQGTIYPDVIESAGAKTGKAQVIKSHHNVGGLPETMTLQLVEPLRELFKDEVRRVGLELGLPESLIFRHPFPGPGLALRIVGEVTAAYCDLLRYADAIFIKALRDHGHYDQVSQAFAVFLPAKSVGVKGDVRCYGYTIALRSVTTVDFMTAKWSELPYQFLSEVSNRIINEIPDIARVVYDISGKPPATIEWE